MVTVKSFGSRMEALAAKELLEKEKVFALVSSDDQGGLNPGLAFTHGVDLKVPAQDAARAKEILFSAYGE